MYGDSNFGSDVWILDFGQCLVLLDGSSFQSMARVSLLNLMMMQNREEQQRQYNQPSIKM